MQETLYDNLVLPCVGTRGSLTRELFLGKLEHEVRTIRGRFAVRHYLSPLGQRGVHARVIAVVVAVLLAVDQLEHFPPFFGPLSSQLRLRQKIKRDKSTLSKYITY